MSRYDGPSEKSEFEPGSNNLVLRNRLGLTTQTEIELAESGYLALAQAESYGLIEAVTVLDSRFVSRMHRLWLGEVYDFAGQFRKVDVSKGGILFCPHGYVPNELSRFDRESAQTFPEFVGNPHRTIEQLGDRLASYHAELILIHPFREGNGRLGRWMADLMALQCGMRPPRYQLDTPEPRADYFRAMSQGYAGDLTKLAGLFLRWLIAGQESMP